MKTSKVRLLSLFCAIVLLFTISVSATADRASDYIDYTFVDCYVADGTVIYVTFAIGATNFMDELGASKIAIYEKSGSSWSSVHTFDKYDTGMISSGVGFYGNTISYTGEDNTEYKVVITLYAKDSTGSDSRTKTYYVET